MHNKKHISYPQRFWNLFVTLHKVFRIISQPSCLGWLPWSPRLVTIFFSDCHIWISHYMKEPTLRVFDLSPMPTHVFYSVLYSAMRNLLNFKSYPPTFKPFLPPPLIADPWALPCHFQCRILLSTKLKLWRDLVQTWRNYTTQKVHKYDVGAHYLDTSSLRFFPLTRSTIKNIHCCTSLVVYVWCTNAVSFQAFAANFTRIFNLAAFTWLHVLSSTEWFTHSTFTRSPTNTWTGHHKSDKITTEKRLMMLC